VSARLPERLRLQPALIDRLTDDAVEEKSEPLEARVLNRQQLRQAVLRDLEWLLNAVQPQRIDAATYPHAAASTLNYGLPPLAGGQASMLHIGSLEASIAKAITTFEPRILRDSLRVKAVEAESVLDTHNVIQIEIRGMLWAQPVPLEMLIRPQLDLESGQVVVRDVR